MAAFNPFLKLVHCSFGHRSHTLPTLLVIAQVCCLCFFHRIKAKHDLMLIKLFCIYIELIYHKYFIAVQVWTKENINMVAIYSLCATNLTIGVIHYLLPLLAISIRSSTHTAFRVLNSKWQAPQSHMTLPIILRFLLCFGRIGVRLCFGYSKFLCWRKFNFTTILLFFNTFLRNFLRSWYIFCTFVGRNAPDRVSELVSLCRYVGVGWQGRLINVGQLTIF